jgi:hypothetical protein
MAIHEVVFKGAQFGLQSVLNTGVAADIKLLVPGFSRIMPKASGGYSHTNAGSRIPTASVPPGMHWGEVDFDGPMDYRAMCYMLASGLGLPAPVADGTNGWIWDFFIELNSGITRQYLTYENGNADRAERAINAFANSFTFNVSKATQSYSGRMLTGKKERDATITGAPDEVEGSIIAPQDFDLYAGDTKAALDTAVSTDDKFPIGLSVVFTIPDLAGIIGRINSDEDSFFDVLEKALIPTWALKAADDDDFDDLMAILETGAKKFFALQALGNVIAGGTPSQEACRIDFCGTLIEPETPDTEEDAATNTATFQNQYDSTWGKSFNVRLVNDLPDLTP